MISAGPISSKPISSAPKFVVAAAPGGFIPYPRPRGIVAGMFTPNGGMQQK